MAKRYGKLWEKVTSMENLELALRMALRKKRKYRTTQRVLKNKEYYLGKIQSMLQNGTYKPSKYKIKLLFEPKLRIIYAAPFYPDRIVHHAIMNVLEPIYDGLMFEHSYSCRKGKGQHAASDKCMEYARKYKYCLQCDCSQFYINIDHDIMKKLYRWKIKDKRLLVLLDVIIDSMSTRANNINILKGLIEKSVAIEQAEKQLKKLERTDTLFSGADAGETIGNLPSQWDGNLYMTEFDYYVSNTLGCKAYIRFCDDFLLFSNDKSKLAEWREKMREFLLTKRSMILSKTEVFPTSQGVDFCGYRHFHNGKKLVRKRTAKRAKQRIKTILNKINYGEVTAKSAMSVVGSTWGILKHAKTYNLRRSMNFESISNEVKRRAKAEAV